MPTFPNKEFLRAPFKKKIVSDSPKWVHNTFFVLAWIDWKKKRRIRRTRSKKIFEKKKWAQNHGS